jgi:hypothetical protein
MNIPPEYYCPLTGRIMRDPVVAMDGFSYEREAIENWFRENDKSNGEIQSPKTNALIDSSLLIPNINLRILIQQFLERNVAIAHDSVFNVSTFPPREAVTRPRVWTIAYHWDNEFHYEELSDEKIARDKFAVLPGVATRLLALNGRLIQEWAFDESWRTSVHEHWKSKIPSHLLSEHHGHPWRIVYHWENAFHLFSFNNEQEARAAYTVVPHAATRLLAHYSQVVDEWYANHSWEDRVRKYWQESMDL